MCIRDRRCFADKKFAKCASSAPVCVRLAEGAKRLQENVPRDPYVSCKISSQLPVGSDLPELFPKKWFRTITVYAFGITRIICISPLGSVIFRLRLEQHYIARFSSDTFRLSFRCSCFELQTMESDNKCYASFKALFILGTMLSRAKLMNWCMLVF